MARGTRANPRPISALAAMIVGPIPKRRPIRAERTAPTNTPAFASANTPPIRPGDIPSLRTAKIRSTASPIRPKRLIIAVQAVMGRMSGWPNTYRRPSAMSERIDRAFASTAREEAGASLVLIRSNDTAETR